MKTLLGAALLGTSLSVFADCERTHLPRTDTRDVDGPGSFGPLEDTLTLGCLRYVGFVETKGRPVAVIEDETGAKYLIRVEDHIGENFGTVTNITQDSIEIVQIVKGTDGEYAKTAPKYLRREGK